MTIGLLACQLDYLASSETPTRTATLAPKTSTPTRVPPVAQVLPPPPAPVEPTPIPAPVIAQITDNLRVRSTPSTSGAIVDRLNKGDKIQILGRTAANDWLVVPLPSNLNARGWIAAAFVQLNGPLDSLPVFSPGPVPPAPRVYP